MPPENLKLVTVSSRGFLPGTRVMLDSFLAYNSWFSGSITVVHTELDEVEQAELAADFPGLACCNPPTALLSALARLADERPHLASRIARFHSLAIFWLEASGDILFLDSDLVFTGDVSDIFEQDGAFLAAPDRAALMGNQRDRKTLEERVDTADHTSADSFNAGLMVMRESLDRSQYQGPIISALDPKEWDDLQSDHTDQALLFRMFGAAVSLIDQRFNRLVGHTARLRGIADLPLDQARVLHFNGPAKPWIPLRHRSAAAQNGAFIKALEHWHAAHRRYLARRHFASRTGSAQ